MWSERSKCTNFYPSVFTGREWTYQSREEADLCSWKTYWAWGKAVWQPPLNHPTWHLVTFTRPDIVLVRPREVILLELTISNNSPESLSNCKERKEYKQNYQLVLGDLDARGLSSLLYTIEIGALSHWLPCTCSALWRCFPSLNKSTTTRLLDLVASLVVAASHIIFHAQKSPMWNSEVLV